MIKYRYERSDTAQALIKLIKYNYKKVEQPEIPVDLKEVYWDYNYGIYRH